MAVIDKITLLGDAEIADRQLELLRRQQARKFRARPAVELAFVPFAVRIFGGIKAALGMGHVAQDVIEDVARALRMARLPSYQPSIEIQLRELGVVVEHLFEMRHKPFSIYGVAGEAAAELIMNASGGHALTSLEDHFRGFVVFKAFRVAKQKLRLARLREFWRPAEATVARVVGLLEGGARMAHGLGRQDDFGQPPIGGGGLFEAGVNVRCGVGQRPAPVLPELLNLLQETQEAGPPLSLVRREISAAKEGFELRGEEHVQGPASLAGGRLHERHVDLVHVRPFLPVNFDADKMLVQEFGQLLFLERLAFHDMAPVAGRVTDAEKNRLVLLPRLFECFRAPGVPIDRIELVLQQVGRFLARKAVGVGVAGGWSLGCHNAFRFRYRWFLRACRQSRPASQCERENGSRLHRHHHTPLERGEQRKARTRFFHRHSSEGDIILRDVVGQTVEAGCDCTPAAEPYHLHVRRLAGGQHDLLCWRRGKSGGQVFSARLRRARIFRRYACADQSTVDAGKSAVPADRFDDLLVCRDGLVGMGAENRRAGAPWPPAVADDHRDSEFSGGGTSTELTFRALAPSDLERGVRTFQSLASSNPFRRTDRAYFFPGRILAPTGLGRADEGGAAFARQGGRTTSGSNAAACRFMAGPGDPGRGYNSPGPRGGGSVVSGH